MHFLFSLCVQAQWYHQGAEPLGRPWQRGDVVGCLVDMDERTMMVTVNGELLFDGRGSELAAKDFDISDGLFKFVHRIILTLKICHDSEINSPLRSRNLQMNCYFPWFLRPAASGESRGEPGGEAKLGPLRWFSAVLHCLWPAGGISTICCQHGQRPSSVDELATASV